MNANRPLAEAICRNLEVPLGRCKQSRFSDGELFAEIGENVRGLVVADKAPSVEADALSWSWTLAPGESKTVLFKIPYVVLTEKAEQEALAKLQQLYRDGLIDRDTGSEGQAV